MVILALSSSLTLAETPASAQDAPPDLRTLKAGLRKNLLTSMLPEMKAHREALLSLEQKQAAAQDFAGAIKSRDERVKLERQIAVLEQEVTILASRRSVASAAQLTARIELKPSEAKLSVTQLDAADGAITGWGQEGAAATWQLPGLPAGGYEVLLRCMGPAGEVVVREGFYSLTSPCRASNEKSGEQNLGTLRIRDGTGTLTLVVGRSEKSSEWRVYSVALVPAAILSSPAGT